MCVTNQGRTQDFVLTEAKTVRPLPCFSLFPLSSLSWLSSSFHSLPFLPFPPFPFPSPITLSLFLIKITAKAGLNDHEMSHTGEKLYSCTQCGNCFANQNYLTTHMIVHSSKFKCTECGKCCRSIRDLTRHRQHHSGEKPFECTVCSKRFTRSGILNKHRRVHDIVCCTEYLIHRKHSLKIFCKSKHFPRL